MSQSSSSLKKLAYDFVRLNRAGYLATVNTKNVPHVALVYFLVKPDLSLYFMTRAESRKFKNLLKNPIVSISFASTEQMITVQATGKATRVDDLKEEQEIMYRLLEERSKEGNFTVPPLQLFHNGDSSEVAVIKVVPDEMVYANFEPMPNGRYKKFFEQVI